MTEPNTEQTIEAEDLDLVNPALEDEGKTAAELWQEMDADEEDAATDGDATAGSDAAADTEDAAPASREKGDVTAQTDGAGDGQGGEEAPPARQAKAAPKDEAPAIDWSKAPPEARAAYEKLEAERNKLQQSERSQRGRVSTLQRQLNEQAARERQRQTGSGPQTGADQGKPAAKTDPLLDDPEIQAVVDEYPDVAKPILKAVSKVAERQTQRDQADEERARVAHWNGQAALLKKEHADYQDVLAANWDAFEGWLQEQPRHIQEAAQRNLKEIEDAAEAADVIGRFKAFRSTQDPPANSGAGKPGSLSGRRQRQLDSSSAARGRGVGAARGIPEDGDPEQLWKMWDEEDARLAKTG